MHTRLLLVLLMLAASASVAADKDLNSFKNFTYPFSRYRGWPHELKWQDVNEPNEVTLVEGKWREPESEPDQPFNGLVFETVASGDVTGDGVNEALVVLRYETGGTQNSYWVYIYSLREKSPRLLAYFHAGDRAAKGLYRVYAQRRNLVVELFDPAKRQGDCCSDGLSENVSSGPELRSSSSEEMNTELRESRRDWMLTPLVAVNRRVALRRQGSLSSATFANLSVLCVVF